jgi:plastocyanin
MMGLTVALGPASSRGQSSRGGVPDVVTIRLSSFAFNPNQVRLHSGVPVTLHLVNDSSGGHNFSAPAFFAASAYPSGAPPRNGKVEIAARESLDITVVPGAAGTYRVECTHFLHSLFGMTGSITVTSP